MVKCDDEGPFRQIYAVGRAGSRTPDPYDSQGVQLQVRVDLQLDIHSFVAVCRVLRSARKNEKNASGAGQKTKMFSLIIRQSGVCFR